jgi:predicted ATPase/class 3 adenylate cyclase
MSEREQLEQAIAALEAQRTVLGDAIADIALAPLREKLAALETQSRAAEPQLRYVTVLFTDVASSTQMGQQLDPEEIMAIMDGALRRFKAIVEQHEGRVLRFMGDGLKAAFGLPISREDDAKRAIRAGLALLADAQAYAQEVEHHWGLSGFSIRVGINTGQVIHGGGVEADNTAMGMTVNLAARMESTAPPGCLQISHATYRHVRGVFNVQPREPMRVKGKDDLIQTYLVQSAKPRAFRMPTRGVEGIETRTIGRAAELRRIQAALSAAIEARAISVVTVVGDAGVGKSRLLYEFTNWLDLQPHGQHVWLFKGRATQEMTGLPYALLRDILAFRFDIQDSDRAALAREKLEQGITNVMGADGLEMSHFIGYLIGLDVSDSPFLAGIRDDARQIHDRAFFYIAQFFAALTQDYPAVMLLEDIHWADDSSLNLIDYLAHGERVAPLLIVGLARPTLFERRPTWGTELERHTNLELNPLSDDDSRALVVEILRNVPAVPPELLNLIVSRADGSPFYIEELIKMLIEDDVILIGEDPWRVNLGRLDALRVPPTLTGVLQARLDSLPHQERVTLQQASVIGRVFWSDAVKALQRIDSHPWPEDALRRLSHKELIFQRELSAFAETQEFIFKHAILRDVTYESVLKRLRRHYHAQAASWLSDHGGERVGEYAGLIGEHFERAGDAQQAAEWYARAAQQACKIYATEAAIGYYQRALAFWNNHASMAVAAEIVEAYEGLGEMLNWQGRYDEAAEAYAAMRDVAGADALAAQARADNGLAMARAYQGDHRAALESAEQAEKLAQVAGAHVELAVALRIQGQSLFRLGDAGAALAIGERALALSAEMDDHQSIGRNLNLLGAVHNILGHYHEANQAWEEALAVFEAAGDRRMVGVLLNNLGVIAEARGEDQTAFERYRDAAAIARAIGHRNDEMVYRSNLAGARIRLSEYQAAERDLLQIIQMAGASGGDMLADAYRLLAQTYLGQHKLPGALTAASRALELGHAADVPEVIGTAWRILGMIASDLPFKVSDMRLAENSTITGLQPSEIVTPEICFAESLRIFIGAGMAGERAKTLQSWATHELERGDQTRGAAMWQTAKQIFMQLGADFEAERMDHPTHSTQVG